MSVKFEIIEMNPKNTISTLVTNGDKAIVFDPWGSASDWKKLLDSRGLKLEAIYITHGHGDHISAAPELAEMFGVNWFMHIGDFELMPFANRLLEMMGMPLLPDDAKKPADISDKTELTVLGDVNVKVYETPGHSPGGVIYHFPESKVVVMGDTLFQESIGAYHFPGGDKDTLFKSIAKIYELNLPYDTVVIHGHGGHTTIGWLKENNPYFTNKALV